MSTTAGSVALAYEASPSRLATVAYPRGAGTVVYSTIPLDYSLAELDVAVFAECRSGFSRELL
ncbi:MAG: hypothetical protein WKF61_08810, partial [Luteimonas sp.]